MKISKLILILICICRAINAMDEGMLLVAAIEQGNYDRVRSLLESGTNPNINIMRGSNEETPLIVALYKKQPRIARLLITKGANVNATDTIYHRTPLILAVMKGYLSIVKELLKVSDINVNAASRGGDTALMFAAEKGYTEIVDELLHVSGINVNAHTGWGETALSFAIRNNNKNIVDLLLRVPDIEVNMLDAHGRTPLIWANGNADIVRALLEIRDIDVYAVDLNNNTAVMRAAEADHVDVVKEFIAYFNQLLNKPLDRAEVNRIQTQIIESIKKAKSMEVINAFRSLLKYADKLPELKKTIEAKTGQLIQKGGEETFKEQVEFLRTKPLMGELLRGKEYL